MGCNALPCQMIYVRSSTSTAWIPSSSLIQFAAVVPYGEVDCPYPLKFNYDGQDHFEEWNYNGAMMCLMPCPNPMWSESEWVGAEVVVLVFGAVGGILSAFVVPPPVL